MRVAPVPANNIQVLWIYHCLRWAGRLQHHEKKSRADKLHFTAATVFQCKKKSEPSKATDDAVIAYVHQLSPSKRNKKDTLYYSTLLLQTSEDGCQDALLYSKQKHKLLSVSQMSHTPVKIQRFTHTSDGKKLIINDITKRNAFFCVCLTNTVQKKTC